MGDGRWEMGDGYKASRPCTVPKMALRHLPAASFWSGPSTRWSRQYLPFKIPLASGWSARGSAANLQNRDLRCGKGGAAGRRSRAGQRASQWRRRGLWVKRGCRQDLSVTLAALYTILRWLGVRAGVRTCANGGIWPASHEQRPAGQAPPLCRRRERAGVGTRKAEGGRAGTRRWWCGEGNVPQCRRARVGQGGKGGGGDLRGSRRGIRRGPSSRPRRASALPSSSSASRSGGHRGHRGPSPRRASPRSRSQHGPRTVPPRSPQVPRCPWV